MNRSEFFAKLEPFLAPSTMLNIELAYTLAKYGHRAQVRKELDENGNPLRYFEHVRRVAIILIDEARIVEPSMIIAALLHDAIEDTRDLTPAMIEHTFGKDVVCIVKTLSKVPYEGYIDRFYMSQDWRPFLIKACDRLDNLRSLRQTEISFQKRQLQETVDIYYPLFEHMIGTIPKGYLRDAIRMYELIKNEVESLTAV